MPGRSLWALLRTGPHKFNTQIHSSKLTWQWKMPMFNREYIFNRSIFHWHVSLPEGTKNSHIQQTSQTITLGIVSFVFMGVYPEKYQLCNVTHWPNHSQYKRLDNVLRVQIGDVEQLPHPNSMDIPSANPGQVEFYWTHFPTEMLMKVGKCFDRTPREFSTAKKIKHPKHLRKMPTLDYQ